MRLFDTIFGRRCRLCGKRAISTLGDVAPTHPGQFHTNNFTLQHCSKCEVVYLDPLPTAADLKLLYEESVQFSDAHYTDPVQVGKILDHYGSTVRTLELLPAGGSVLEIGAGLAWVSRVCKSADPAARTVAQDISGECAKACPWVDRYFVGALDALPERGPYQLISLTHVIEHLAEPAAMLRKIATLLAPGGKAFITAPFRPSGWQMPQGIEPWRDYSYLHVPAHITYFSRLWFELQTHLLGLEILHWDDSHENGQAFDVVLHRK
jgi:2-polyprenyl-3-methyl-5-hydroxy-6-metoxy-1,4-benzoquinol methylase